MDVRKRVKYNFLFIIILLVIITIMNSLIVFKIKENSDFRSSIADIITVQEDMDEILQSSINSEDIETLLSLNKDFTSSEKKFELLKNDINSPKHNDIFDSTLPELTDNKLISSKIKLLFNNEHKVEIAFDKVFEIHKDKLKSITAFNVLYPIENKQRKDIEELIYKTKNLELTKLLGHMRYYSKEMLYQKKDLQTLQKWKHYAEEIYNISEQKHYEYLESLSKKYVITVQNIGDLTVNLSLLKEAEKNLELDIQHILKDNRRINIEIEKLIEETSKDFINNMSMLQNIIALIIIVLTLLLSYKVATKVTLTMDEIEEQVQDGLKEISALNHEIEDTQKEVVFTMGAIGESRSKETGAHVKRVAEYTKLLAQLYGLSEQESEMLKQASPMHDIGKVAIADSILNKPAKFTPEERTEMEKHALMGYEMLKHSNRPLLKAASIVARDHHEKWDGTGYPYGLKEDDIHIYGRITAVADVFDALGSDRVYKKAWELDRILQMFEEEKGKHFDPKLIELFFEHLDKFLHIRDTIKDN